MILKTLAESARMRVESAKQIVPYDVLKDRAKEGLNSREAFAFEKALKGREYHLYANSKSLADQR